MRQEKRALSGGCVVHKKVGGHGPYAYHVRKENGKQTWTYLGRSISYLVDRAVNDHQQFVAGWKRRSMAARIRIDEIERKKGIHTRIVSSGGGPQVGGMAEE